MHTPANPQEILALSRNFMECRVLLTGAELDIFTHLAQPAASAELAEREGWQVRALTVLLDALSAIGLLLKEDGRYRTEPVLLPFLRSDTPRSVLPMVRHAATIWKNWSNLTRIVAETGGVEGRAGSFEDPEDQKAFIGAMHVVGRARIAEAGLTDRVTIAAGDFHTDPLPPGHDLALLSAIIHMNSPEENRDLYRKTFSALVPGGRIVIRDHVMTPDRIAPGSGALFAVNMLVATPGGGTYTFEEIKAGLEAAGFENVRLIQAEDRMMGLVEAFRPE